MCDVQNKIKVKKIIKKKVNPERSREQDIPNLSHVIPLQQQVDPKP